ALEGGDGDRLHWGLQTELENLVKASRATFERLSQVSAFSSSQANPLANLPALNQAISDRLSQIDTAENLTAQLQPDEIKRLSALIYGLRAIASELKDLADEASS
ncbi:MAG: hypothetical protein WBM44_05275, partial [Waterburya sp.]